MQRYFAINENLELSKEDIHHIKDVMRMKIKDNFIVIYNEKLFLCEIEDILKNNIVFNILNEIKENNELNKKIVVAFSLVNENKTDMILQKCTELGVDSFIPILTNRSKIKINEKSNKKIERWTRICKEASEQSHRNKIPKIYDITELKNLKKINMDLKIVCSTKENIKSLKNVLQNSTKYDTIIIVVGPEGGLTEKEEIFLNENDFISVNLGKSILRTETAPIFAVSAIKYELMR